MANKKLTPIQWVICGVAALGFAFDTYVLLMLPLIVGPALLELGKLKPGTPAYNDWVGLLFYVPAVAGGIFGMIGGYLTDRLGRQRVLVWSILLYAVSAGAAAYATSLPMLLVLRCATFIGVCVEFVAAVAWLAELFDDPKQRESVLGYTQAFSSVGGFMVSGAYVLAVKYGGDFPAIFGCHEAWRYTLLSGVIPALPLMIIRPFLPESPVWKAKKAAGTLKRPSFMELFRPEFRRTTIVTAIMFACSYGAAFGAIQHLPRIVPGLPGVRDMKPAPRPRAAVQTAGAAGCTENSVPSPIQQTVGAVQVLQETGGLVGRVILAFLAIRIISRRKLLRVFQVPGLIIVPLVFFWPAVHDLQMLKIGVFVAGLLTVAQFSFWGNYLPLMYPVHLRGTGESFAANVGGRMIGTCFALVTTQLANVTPGNSPSTKLAYASAIVALGVYAVGFLSSFWLPEPDERRIQE
jgi:MFS family permease